MAALTRAQIFKLLFSGGNYAKQYLIKLYHPVAGVLRYVNNNQDITYDGYTGYGEAAMPPYLGETTNSAIDYLKKARPVLT